MAGEIKNERQLPAIDYYLQQGNSKFPARHNKHYKMIKIFGPPLKGRNTL